LVTQLGYYSNRMAAALFEWAWLPGYPTVTAARLN